MLSIFQLFVVCERADIGTEHPSVFHRRARPLRFLVYDATPGGSGVALSALPRIDAILRTALKVVEQCDCSQRAGCPACTQDARCPEFNQVLDKDAALIILRAILIKDPPPAARP